MQHKIAKIIQSCSCALFCFFFTSGVYLYADDANVIETYLNELLITGQLNDPGDELRDVLLFLRSFPILPDSLGDAFTQLQPSWYADLAWSAENSLTNASRIISNNVLARMREYEGISCNPCGACIPFKNWWFAAQGGYLRQGKLQNLPSFRSKDWGILSGFDFVLADWLVLGITGGYTHTNLTWANLSGRNTIQNFYIGPYCAWNYGCWTVEASILKGAQHYCSNRHIQFGFVNRRAKNTHYGDSILCHLGTTINYGWGPLDFTPYLYADYIYLNVDKIKEKGSHYFDLHIKSYKPQFFQGEIGTALSGIFNINATMVVPTVMVGYQNITPLTGRDLIGNFLHRPVGSFHIKTTRKPIYQWTTGVLLNLYFPNCPELSFSYHGESGNKRWAYYCTGEINWSF